MLVAEHLYAGHASHLGSSATQLAASKLLVLADAAVVAQFAVESKLAMLNS